MGDGLLSPARCSTPTSRLRRPTKGKQAPCGALADVGKRKASGPSAGDSDEFEMASMRASIAANDDIIDCVIAGGSGEERSDASAAR